MTSSGAYPPRPSEYLSSARNVGLDRDTGRSLAGASVTHSRRDAAAWSNIAGARRRHRTIAPHAARAPRHLPLAARPHDASASSSLLAAPVHLAHRGLAAETTSPSAPDARCRRLATEYWRNEHEPRAPRGKGDHAELPEERTNYQCCPNGVRSYDENACSATQSIHVY